MKIFLLLLTLFVSINALTDFELVDLKALALGNPEILQNPPQCRKTKYGGIGADCEPAWNATNQCKTFLTCQKGKCQPGWIGAQCSSHSDCYLGTEESVRCVNGKCTKKRYNGYPCTINDECYSSTCTDGVCRGYGIGELCNFRAPVECDKGLYCSRQGSVCIKQKQLGENCDDFDDTFPRNELPEGSNYMIICPGGSGCVWKGWGNGSRCEEVYNKKEGEACTSNTQCQFPLFCAQNRRICVRRTFGDVPCGAKNCTTNLNERCICQGSDPMTCKVTANSGCSFQDSLNQWYACNKQYNCHYENNVFTAMLTEMFQKETCMGQNCGHIPRAALCCRNNGFQDASYSTAFNGPLDCAAGVNNGIIAVVIILMLVVLSALAVAGSVLAIYLYQKRKSESFERLPD